MSRLDELRKSLRSHSNPQKAKILQSFFKTGPGEYGEGDCFLGITVPLIRKTIRSYSDLSLSEVKKILISKIHEERLSAVMILVKKYEEAVPREQEIIYQFYLTHSQWINNWDLVDVSAHKIVGRWLRERSRAILYQMAKSKCLWKRRMSIVSTFDFIRAGDMDETIRLAGVLLRDKHDLMHKAVGWMLREVGKRKISVLEEFLKSCYREMPRTMLRYAIEKFPEEKRKAYLNGKIKMIRKSSLKINGDRGK